MISESHRFAGNKTSACSVYVLSKTHSVWHGLGNCYLKVLKICFLFYLITSVLCSPFHCLISGQDVAVCIWVHGVRLRDRLCKSLFERNQILAHFHSLQFCWRPEKKNGNQFWGLILQRRGRKPSSSFLLPPAPLSPRCVFPPSSGRRGCVPEQGGQQEDAQPSPGTWEQHSVFEASACVSMEMPGLFLTFKWKGCRWIITRSKPAQLQVQGWAPGARGLAGCCLSFFFISSHDDKDTLLRSA